MRRFQHSTDDQIRACREWAERNDIDVLDAHVFVDERQTGKKRRRTGLAAVMAAVERGEIDVLVIFSTSRLSRKLYQSLRFVEEEILDRRKRCVFIKSGIDTDNVEHWRRLLQLAVLATLAFADLRVGEAVALRPVDVDLKLGVLRVRGRGDWGPKTEGSERDVPIHPRLMVVLAAKPKGKGGWFFNAPPSRRFPDGDHHLNPREVNEQFQKLAKACGFAVGRSERALTLHALRRFFKTFCMDAGVPKPMVDAWMGHQDQADIDTFYYSPQKSKEWMDRVPFGSPDEDEVKRVRPASSPAA